MSLNNVVHVVVAVVKNEHGEYFIAKRHENSHQGNLWEFPGGKVENNETVIDALKRELFEEIGITLLQTSPLIQIHHNYEDKSVLLDVWYVDKFDGEAFGKEGQKTCWINQNEFSLYDFPAANLPVLKAIKLPDRCMITGKFKDEKEFLDRIQISLENEVSEKGLDQDGYIFEEIGECLFELDRADEAKVYFGLAYGLLSKDEWLKSNEPERLERLKYLSE